MPNKENLQRSNEKRQTEAKAKGVFCTMGG